MKAVLVLSEKELDSYPGKLITRSLAQADTLEDAKLAASRIAARSEDRAYVAVIVGYYEPVYDPKLGWHDGIE